jgi:hypothetical protein
MEKQDFIRALRTLGRTVAYYPVFSKIFENSNCGVFISQMLYWEGKQDDEEGWIRKPLNEIEEELHFTRYEMETIRKRLKEAKVLEECRMGMPAKLHFKFDWSRVNDLINDYHIKIQNKTLVPEVKADKQPTIVYRMKEYFLEKLTEYVKGAEYSWMEKDWGSMKNLRDLFEKRVIEKKKNANADLTVFEATDDEIFNLYKTFIDMLPEWHRTNRYTPAYLYSDFNAIQQQVITETKKKLTNGNNSKTADFSKAAAEAASNV